MTDKFTGKTDETQINLIRTCMTTCLVGVDVGTTNIKALAYRPETDTILAHASAAVSTLTPQPGYAEQAPEAIWTLFCQVIGEVIAQLAQQQITLAGVSFSAAMHSLLAVDAEGKPLCNALLWSDNRAEAQANRLRTTEARFGREIYKRTGIPLHPMVPLCKLAWFDEHDPRLLKRATKWISLKEYLWWHLTGEYQIDYSMATATGLFDSAKRRWYIPALQWAGIRPEQLSTPIPTTFRSAVQAGGTSALAAGTPLFPGASDGCLANLGAGAIGPGITTLTIGTSGAIRRTVSKPLRDPKGRLFSYILNVNDATDKDYYVVGGPTNNGGNVLQWLADHLTHQDAAAVLAEAETVPPGADGLLFLPYLQGERAPLWNAHARGAYLNVAWHHTRAHFVRAGLEGVLFNLLSIEKLLVAETEPTRVIHANGGFAQSAFWVQMLADIFGVPVRLNASNESGAIGAILLMMKAMGQADSLATAVQHVHFGDTFTPDPARQRVYRGVFAEWEKPRP